MTPDILEQCDPGIRPVVAWLWSHGFQTSDSGDGVTKLKDGSGYDPDDIIRVPHVVVSVNQSLKFEVVVESFMQRLNSYAKDVGSEYRIEMTHSLPDNVTTMIFFPSVEWIANLSDSAANS